jgi:hypothetical protein
MKVARENEIYKSLRSEGYRLLEKVRSGLRRKRA